MAAKTKFRGSMTALVTPFKKDGALDEQAFRALVNWQIEQGIQGLVPVGTTGESPTLSHEEHRKVVEICIKETAGRVPVIAGAGSNNTHEAIELARAYSGEEAAKFVNGVLDGAFRRLKEEGLVAD